MKYSQLNRTHPEVDLALLQRHQDLFEGGAAFRARLSNYLPRHDREPLAVYQRRCASAHYLNYAARIVNFFASALMASPPTLQSEPADHDPYWEELREDADGAGTDLVALARRMLVAALVSGRSYLRVEFPEPGEAPPTSLADAEASGLLCGRLCSVPTASIRNWKRRPDGCFVWVLEHERREELADITDEEPTITETWTAWYEDGTARRWQHVYRADHKPSRDTEVDELDPPANPCGAIPLVELCLSPELWLLNLLADPLLEHFRKVNALAWSIDRTCYAMPFFFLKDAKKPPTMGSGYFGMLHVDERVEWPAPPSAPFEVIRNVCKDLVQEIHRVAEQMALAVDNNQAAAVGRSGDSKVADHEATETVLRAYGDALRVPLERALDLVARGRGDAVHWDVSGMDVFDMADAGALTEMVLAAEPLRIPSVTHRRALLKSVSRAQLPHLDEGTRKAIDDEIDAGVTTEKVLRAKAPAVAKPAQGPAAKEDPAAPAAPTTPPSPPR